MKKAVCLIVGILLMASTSFAANGNLTVDGVIHSGGSHYNVLSYNLNGTPVNGVKIRTNIPFANGTGMPTIILEGYDYNLMTPINLMISWYISFGNFNNYGAISSTSYSPIIRLAKETRSGTDYVVIYIDDKRYFSRFSIRAFGKGRGELDSWFENWPLPADEPLTESNMVLVPYRNRTNVRITTNWLAGSTASPLYPAIDFLGFADGNKARIRTSEESETTNGSKFSILVNDGSSATSLVERLTIQKDGKVGIGTSNPNGTLDVWGNIALSGTVIHSSDIKFKRNLLPIHNPLSKVLNLEGVSYEWKTEEYKNKGFSDGRHYGVIAQEIEKVLPEVVSTGADGAKAVAYTEIIPVLIEAIKEQQKRIEKLEKKLEELR